MLLTKSTNQTSSHTYILRFSERNLPASHAKKSTWPIPKHQKLHNILLFFPLDTIDIDLTRTYPVHRNFLIHFYAFLRTISRLRKVHELLVYTDKTN